MYAVEVEAGRMEAFTDDVSIVMEARWWGLTPEQYLEMSAYWAELGAMIRQAENAARRKANKR